MHDKCSNCPLNNYTYEGVLCVGQTSHRRFCDLIKNERYKKLIIEKSLDRYFDCCYNDSRSEIVFAYVFTQGDSGLSVSTMHAVAVLNRVGLSAKEVGCTSLKSLRRHLSSNTKYVILQAVWYSMEDLVSLAKEFPRTKFVSLLHSNLAFLTTESHIIQFQRELIQRKIRNISIGCVSMRLSNFWKEAYGIESLYLPNLYNVPNETIERDCGILKVGSFGAMRLQKHHVVAAGAALVMARHLDIPVEFHMNVGKNDSGILNTIKALMKDSGVNLVEVPWMDSMEFARYTAKMNLCLQPTSTETFNYVTADAAAYCVPSLVGEAIEWMPDDMKIFIDDPVGVGKRALEVLRDDTAGARCRMALECKVRDSISHWMALC